MGDYEKGNEILNHARNTTHGKLPSNLKGIRYDKGFDGEVRAMIFRADRLNFAINEG